MGSAPAILLRIKAFPIILQSKQKSFVKENFKSKNKLTKNQTINVFIFEQRIAIFDPKIQKTKQTKIFLYNY